MARWVGLALLPLLAGCSTVYDATGRTSLGPDGPHVYGGVRAFANGDGFIGDYGRVFRGLEGFSSVDAGPAAAVGAVLVAPVLIDFALSAVTDTLLLPFSLGRSERSSKWW